MTKANTGDSPDYRKLHVFDPIHNGADECECGLVKDADLHSMQQNEEQVPPERIVERGGDTDWPLSEVLRHLVEWAQHLHVSHECDCHGWEARTFAVDAAAAYIKQIRADLTTAGAVSIPDVEEIVRLAHGVERNCLSRTCFIRDSHREACHGCDDFQAAVKAVAQRLYSVPDAISEVEKMRDEWFRQAMDLHACAANDILRHLQRSKLNKGEIL
jgi:hypothetical protein